MKYLVLGSVIANVSVEVEAKSKDEAMDIADDIFGGITNYVGISSYDKLIGVSNYNESIVCKDWPEWKEAKEI